MNFVIDLAHHSLEHRSAASEGPRFDSSWGLRIFFLSPALMRRRKTSLSISLPSQTVNNGERLLSFPISSLVTVPKQLILRWFCDLSASYREKKGENKTPHTK